MAASRALTGLFSLVLLACGDDRTGPVADAGTDASTYQDSGRVDVVVCGTRVCTTSTSDAVWGGQACCVSETRAECGVKADAPTIDDGTGKRVLLSDLLEMVQAMAPEVGVVDTRPQIPCLPKNAAGDADARCPSESIDLGATGADAGADDAGASMPFEVVGCCRPDGMCGYLDNETGFGCVRISESLLGQVFARADQSCDGY